MVNNRPRNTRKETDEKTTERTIKTCTAWSHSEEVNHSLSHIFTFDGELFHFTAIYNLEQKLTSFSVG